MFDTHISKFLTKDHKHDHYWIEDEILYESYHTLRGLRFRQIMEVPGLPNMDKVDESCMLYSSKEYPN